MWYETETLEAVQSGDSSRMVEAKVKSLESVEFSVSVHIHNNSKWCKWLIMEWQEIPNQMHVIRHSSLAQFLCGSWKRASPQVICQYGTLITEFRLININKHCWGWNNPHMFESFAANVESYDNARHIPNLI